MYYKSGFRATTDGTLTVPCLFRLVPFLLGGDDICITNRDFGRLPTAP